MRHRISRAGPSPVLVQLPARLVQKLLRHRARPWPISMPSRAARKPGGAKRRTRRQRAPALRPMPRRSVLTAPANGSIPWRAMCCFAADRSPRSPICRCRNSPPLAKFKLQGRELEIARDLLRRTAGAHRVSVRRRPRLFAARSCRAHAFGRRGAAHPPRGPARLEFAGGVLRARRAHDRLAPARQPGAARYARPAARPRATPSSSSSMTRKRYAAPITSSTGSRRRQARRPLGRARHGGGARPHRAIRPPGAASQPRSRTRAHAAGRSMPSGPRFESSARRCTICARSTRAFRSPLDRRHRRLGLRQVLARA